MMESQALEAGSSRKDQALLALAVILFSGGLFAFYYFEAELPAVVRVLLLLAAIGAAAAIGYRTATGQAVWGAITGARTELRKVVWPSRKESVQTTLMIAVVVLIMSLLMWGLDGALLFGVEKLTGRG
jgi:preprotein translocase subunit SecE